MLWLSIITSAKWICIIPYANSCGPWRLDLSQLTGIVQPGTELCFKRANLEEFLTRGRWWTWSLSCPPFNSRMIIWIVWSMVKYCIDFRSFHGWDVSADATDPFSLDQGWDLVANLARRCAGKRALRAADFPGELRVSSGKHWILVELPHLLRIGSGAGVDFAGLLSPIWTADRGRLSWDHCQAPPGL